MKFIPSKIWLIILFLSGVTCGVLLSKFLFKFQDRLQTSQASQAQELPTIPNQVQGKMSLYVLAGQSNMTGRGPLDAESSKNTPPRFLYLGMITDGTSPKTPWIL